MIFEITGKHGTLMQNAWAHQLQKNQWTSSYAIKLQISTKTGTIVDGQKVLKQAGVAHNIKPQ